MLPAVRRHNPPYRLRRRVRRSASGIVADDFPHQPVGVVDEEPLGRRRELRGLAIPLLTAIRATARLSPGIVMTSANTTADLTPLRHIQRAEVDDLVQRIALAFRPERIILFGSYANGQPRPDSDVDLLVVMETTLREADQAVAIVQAVQPAFGVDLIVRTPTNLDRRLVMGDWFLRDIVERGEVMYERAGAGVGDQGRG
jgi:predicted nucleotidyltransferase